MHLLFQSALTITCTSNILHFYLFFSPKLIPSSFYFPLHINQTTALTTTLLEASLGVQCWFTQVFREVYRVEADNWIAVQSPDNIWIYIADQLVQDAWG